MVGKHIWGEKKRDEGKGIGKGKRRRGERGI
jgi:hypothetical protein